MPFIICCWPSDWRVVQQARNPQATVLLYAHPHTLLPGNTTLCAVDELMLCRGLRRWQEQ